MELNLRERTFIGIPDEFYDSEYKSKISDIKYFAYNAKVFWCIDLNHFFGACGDVYASLRDLSLNLNSCKIYTCADLELYENQMQAFEETSKLQVIGLLDLDLAKKPRLIESYLRKWFEAGKSVVLFQKKDIRELDMYSDWFLAILAAKRSV